MLSRYILACLNADVKSRMFFLNFGSKFQFLARKSGDNMRKDIKVNFGKSNSIFFFKKWKFLFEGSFPRCHFRMCEIPSRRKFSQFLQIFLKFCITGDVRGQLAVVDVNVEPAGQVVSFRQVVIPEYAGMILNVVWIMAKVNFDYRHIERDYRQPIRSASRIVG